MNESHADYPISGDANLKERVVMGFRLPYARGRKPRIPGQMNKTEQAYNDHLLLLYKAGEILCFSFEAIKLRLAPNTFYTPDFLVMQNDCSLEFHEVKGHWEDDARVKVKVAADKYPMFRFLAVKALPKKQGGGWEIEGFDK